MTDTENKSPASEDFALIVDLDEPETFVLTGNDPAFTEATNPKVAAAYGGKPFSLVVKRLLPDETEAARDRHTKIQKRPGGSETKTSGTALVVDLFVKCVVSWEGIGNPGKKALPCNDDTKRRFAIKRTSFANAVVMAAMDAGDGLLQKETAEIERFR